MSSERSPFLALVTRRGFTPETLATEAKVSRATVYNAGSGSSLRPVVLAAIARTLGCTESYVLRVIAQSKSEVRR